MNKKKILFVIPYMHEGGAQRALSNIQTHMPDYIEIDTLVNSDINRVYSNSGRVFSLNIEKKARTSSVFFQFGVFIKRVKKIKELKRSNNYNACISFVDSANIANVISAICERDTQTKTIISIRTSITQSAMNILQYRYFVKPIAKILYKRADMIVSVSEELKTELIESLGIKEDRITAIPNGFDVDEILKLSSEKIDSPICDKIGTSKVVFTAGRLNIAKNQWHLIRAFSYVKRTLPDAMLVIAGTGELEEYLKKLAINLGIDQSVVFAGFESNVYKYMRRSDVFVLPSGFEGFPNALGEALCAGVPCIATDFRTGARELLAPERLSDNTVIERFTECTYGIISPVCSGKMYTGTEPFEMEELELAKAILYLLDNKEANIKYREKSKERRKNLDIQKAVSEWIRLIEE